DIAKGNYYRVVERRRAAEIAAARAEMKQRRAQLEAELEELIATAEARYVKPIEVVLAFMTRLKAHFDAVNEYNKLRTPGERDLNTFEQRVRWIPGTPDRTVIVDVERTVPVDGAAVITRETPMKRVLVQESRIIPGRRPRTPAPLHELFEASGLKPDDPLYR